MPWITSSSAASSDAALRAAAGSNQHPERIEFPDWKVSGRGDALRDEIKFEQAFRTRHCEARSAEAIQSPALWPLDCFASLAMTMYLAGALDPASTHRAFKPLQPAG
jgi:hypothetical protein